MNSEPGEICVLGPLHFSVGRGHSSAEVPFPHISGVVAAGLEHIAQRVLTRRKPKASKTALSLIASYIGP